MLRQGETYEPRGQYGAFRKSDFAIYSKALKETKALAEKPVKQTIVEEIEYRNDPIDSSKQITVGQFKIGKRIQIAAAAAAGVPPPNLSEAQQIRAAQLLREQQEYEMQLTSQIDETTVLFTKRYIERKERKQINAKWEARISNALFAIGNYMVFNGAIVMFGPSIFSWAISTGALNNEVVRLAIKVALESTFRMNPQTIQQLDKAMIGIVNASKLSSFANPSDLFVKAFVGKDPFTDSISDDELEKGATVSGGINLDIRKYQGSISDMYKVMVKSVLPPPLQRVLNLFERKPNGNMDEDVKKYFQTQPSYVTSGAASITDPVKILEAMGYNKFAYALGMYRSASDTFGTVFKNGSTFMRDFYFDMYMEIDNVMGMIRNDTLASPTYKQEAAASGVNRLLQSQSLRKYATDFFKLKADKADNGLLREDALLFFGAININTVIGYASSVAYNGITNTISSASKSFFAEKVFPRGSIDPDDDDQQRKRHMEQTFNKELSEQRLRFIKQGLRGDAISDAVQEYKRIYAPPEIYNAQDLSALDSIWRGLVQRTSQLKANDGIKYATMTTSAALLGTLGTNIMSFGRNPLNSATSSSYDIFTHYTSPYVSFVTNFATSLASPALAKIAQGYRDELMSIYQKVYTKAIRETIAESTLVTNMHKWKSNKMSDLKKAMLHRTYLSAFVNYALEPVINGLFKFVEMSVTEIADINYVQPFIQAYVPMYITPYHIQHMFQVLETIPYSDVYSHIGNYAERAGVITPSLSHRLMRDILNNGDGNAPIIGTLSREATGAKEAFGESVSFAHQLLYTLLPHATRNTASASYVTLPTGQILFVDGKEGVDLHKEKVYNSALAYGAELRMLEQKEKGEPLSPIDASQCSSEFLNQIVKSLNASKEIPDPNALCGKMVEYYNDLIQHSDDPDYAKNKRGEYDRRAVFDMSQSLNTMKEPLYFRMNGKLYAMERSSSYNAEPGPFNQYAQFGIVSRELAELPSGTVAHEYTSVDQLNSMISYLAFKNEPIFMESLANKGYTMQKTNSAQSLNGGYSYESNSSLEDHIQTLKTREAIGKMLGAQGDDADNINVIVESIKSNGPLRVAFANLGDISNTIRQASSNLEDIVKNDSVLRTSYENYLKGSRTVDARLAETIRELESAKENREEVLKQIADNMSGKLSAEFIKIKQQQIARNKERLMIHRTYLTGQYDSLKKQVDYIDSLELSEYNFEEIRNIHDDVTSICSKEGADPSLCATQAFMRRMESRFANLPARRNEMTAHLSLLKSQIEELHALEHAFVSRQESLVDMSDLTHRTRQLVDQKTSIQLAGQRYANYADNIQKQSASFKKNVDTYKSRHLAHYTNAITGTANSDNARIDLSIQSINQQIDDLRSAFGRFMDESNPSKVNVALRVANPAYKQYQDQYKTLHDAKMGLEARRGFFKKETTSFRKQLSGDYNADIETAKSTIGLLESLSKKRSVELSETAEKTRSLLAGLLGREGYELRLHGLGIGVSESFDIPSWLTPNDNVVRILDIGEKTSAIQAEQSALQNQKKELSDAQVKLQTMIEELDSMLPTADDTVNVKFEQADKQRNHVRKIQHELQRNIITFSEHAAEFKATQGTAYRKHMLETYDKENSELIQQLTVSTSDIEASIDYIDSALSHLESTPMYDTLKQAEWLRARKSELTTLRIHGHIEVERLRSGRNNIENVPMDSIFEHRPFTLSDDMRGMLTSAVKGWNIYKDAPELEQIRETVYAIAKSKTEGLAILARAEIKESRERVFGSDRAQRVEALAAYFKNHNQPQATALLESIDALRAVTLESMPMMNRIEGGSNALYQIHMANLETISLDYQGQVLRLTSNADIETWLQQLDGAINTLEMYKQEIDTSTEQMGLLDTELAKFGSLAETIQKSSEGVSHAQMSLEASITDAKAYVGKPEFTMKLKRVEDAYKVYSIAAKEANAEYQRDLDENAALRHMRDMRVEEEARIEAEYLAAQRDVQNRMEEENTRREKEDMEKAKRDPVRLGTNLHAALARVDELLKQTTNVAEKTRLQEKQQALQALQQRLLEQVTHMTAISVRLQEQSLEDGLNLEGEVAQIEREIENITDDSTELLDELVEKYLPFYGANLAAFKDMFGNKENFRSPEAFDMEKGDMIERWQAWTANKLGKLQGAERLLKLDWLHENGVYNAEKNPKITKDIYRQKLEQHTIKLYTERNSQLAGEELQSYARMYSTYMTDRIFGENASLYTYDTGEVFETKGGDSIHDRMMNVLGEKDSYTNSRRSILSTIAAATATGTVIGGIVGAKIAGLAAGGSAAAAYILALGGASVSGNSQNIEIVNGIALGAFGLLLATQTVTVGAVATAIVAGTAAVVTGAAIGVAAVGLANLWYNRDYVMNYLDNLAAHVPFVGGRQELQEQTDQLERTLFGSSEGSIRDVMSKMGINHDALHTVSEWQQAVDQVYSKAKLPPIPGIQSGGTRDIDFGDAMGFLRESNANAFIRCIVYKKHSLAFLEQKLHITFPYEFIVFCALNSITYTLGNMSDEEYVKEFERTITYYNDYSMFIVGNSE